MGADVISYVSGALFGVVAVIGLFLNIAVLTAMCHGGLFSSKSSPVYILSAQTICVDTLFLAIHLLYHSPSIAIQADLFSEPFRRSLAIVLNAIFMFCWYHNSLSHILVALNRLFVIVFNRFSVFTRNRTIALCFIQYLVALSLAITSQFILPCCEFTFSWAAFSYTYIVKPNIDNYSNEFVDLPLNSTSSIVSMVSYTIIICTVYSARKRTANELRGGEMTKRLVEYRRALQYAAQFATMALVYSLSWIFFRVFPILIGSTNNLFIYGIIVFLAEVNAMMNATVYLANNKEVQRALRKVTSRKVHTISAVNAQSTAVSVSGMASTLSVATN